MMWVLLNAWNNLYGVSIGGVKPLMRLTIIGIVMLAILAVPIAAFGQAWGSQTTSGEISITWAKQGNEYTFTVINPADSGKAYNTLVWEIVPFKVAAPESVVCPEGWSWFTDGGYNRFALTDSNLRYNEGGPAIEPGESLIFKYTELENADPVNPGGPAEGTDPAFLAKLAAVDGKENGMWIACDSPNGREWYDAPEVSASVSELPSLAILFTSISAFAGLTLKRPRV